MNSPVNGVIGVVVNPSAGHRRGTSIGHEVLAGLVARGHTVKDLSAGSMREAFDQVTDAIARDALAALVVVGGDGMAHLGVNAVVGTDVPVGIVGAGTGNDTAAALGLPVWDASASLNAVDAAIRSGQSRRVDAVRVTGDGLTDAVAHDGATWYIGALSVGLDAAVNARAERMRWPSGPSRYHIAAVRELALYRPYGFAVTTDGALWESGGVLATIANGPAIGGGIRIAPQAALDDGLLDVITAGPVSRLKALPLLRKAYSGAHLGHPMVNAARGTIVRVEASPAHGLTPPTAYADGEPIGRLPLVCTVVPGAVRVLSPVGQ